MSQADFASPDTVEIRDLPMRISDQPAELPTIPGGWTQREWVINGRSFFLTLPAKPDEFLEDPDVHAAFDRDEYMPYWAYLWPAALKMAGRILAADWPPKADVLELGAGIGIVGLAGLSRGLNVVMSDYESKAVALALFNARQNGFTQAEARILDWRSPLERQYTFIWGCDLLYEDRHHQPLLKMTQETLTRDGVAWFADPGRAAALRFHELLPQYGFASRVFDENHQPQIAPLIGQYQMFEIRRRI